MTSYGLPMVLLSQFSMNGFGRMKWETSLTDDVYLFLSYTFQSRVCLKKQYFRYRYITESRNLNSASDNS